MTSLGKAADDYLAVRRALGFKLRDHAGLLRNFAQFLKGENAAHITTDLALRWATQPVAVEPAYWARRLGIARRFAQFVSASDPLTEVPPAGLLPYRYRRKPPYLYQDAEIERLLQAAARIGSATGLRAATYSTLIGLLAVTGLRISEAIALDDEDVDLTEGVLRIRRTKFGKSRFVPMHPSTTRALRRYLRARDRIHPRRSCSALFVGERGRRLTHWTVRRTFNELCRETGLRRPTDHRGPRLHDLRHRLAIKTLITWYRRGLDVERHLPALATYLGHGHINDTYWYVTAVPELLRRAAQRLDRRAGGRP